MQKYIKKFGLLLVCIVFSLIALVGCGEDTPEGPAVIDVFEFKQESYEILLGETANVELNIDEAADKTIIEYSSEDPSIATFAKGILKGVAVGETNISISYVNETNNLKKSVKVIVKLSEAEQAYYDAAKAWDNKVIALENYTVEDIPALKALVDELNSMELAVLNYVTKGDLIIEMYDKARALVIINMINDLPETVTVDDEAVIKAARDAYKNADASVRKHVDNTDKLSQKESDLAKAIDAAIPDGVSIYYEGESYTTVNGNIVLTATTVKKKEDSVIVWTSSDPSVASVVDGVVTGHKAGTAIITATIEGTETSNTAGVTILDGELNEGLQFILDHHNSTVYTINNLMIGTSGDSDNPPYFSDIRGSVNDILFKEYKVRDTYLAQGNASGKTYGEMSSVEFITVHYTGNMAKGANAAANAGYFVSTEDGAKSVSIHYTTGNDGIYHCLDDNLGAYHAGDGASLSGSSDTTNADGSRWNGVGKFEWLSTGVKAPAGVTAHDLLNIEVTVSDDCYYVINGQKTKIKLPEAYSYKGRKGYHTYNDKGQVVNAETGSVRDAETYFNKMGFRFIVEGGEYKMAKTWWCYTQVYEGRICSVGGNRNSIGIESCVNEGSNLWYTWQITAQLVAHLMQENDLDINRVVGHHFYTAKHCPQPMLENDMEIWYEFRDLIEAEYEKLTEFDDYKFELSTNSSTHLHSNGYAKYNRKKENTNVCVDYTVTVTNPDGTTEEITLYSMVPLVNLVK